MITRHEAEIEGIKFDFEQMPAVLATRVLIRVTRAIAEPVTRFLTTADEKQLEKLIDSPVGLGRIGSVIGELADNLSDADFDFVVTSLFRGASVAGKTWDGMNGAHHDAVFRGKQKVFLQAIWEALRFNYADFFGGNL